MAMKTLPEQAVLRQLLDCDPEKGLLTWKFRKPSDFTAQFHTAEAQAATWNARWGGKPAFNSLQASGYYCGMILAQSYQAHRIIWMWVHGEQPDVVDHINRDRTDNRIANLRSVTHTENLMNRGTQKNNTSGHRGVVKCSVTGRWRVEVQRGGRRIRIGSWLNFNEAVAARRAAEKELGFHHCG